MKINKKKIARRMITSKEIKDGVKLYDSKEFIKRKIAIQNRVAKQHETIK